MKVSPQQFGGAPLGREPAPDRPSSYRILVRDLVLPWRIGVWRHEKDRQQRVRLNLDLQVSELPDSAADNYDDVLCYEKIVDGIRALAARGHVKLAETLADQVAVLCLADPRALHVTVRIEKLEAIEDAASVGVEVTRFRADRIGVADPPLRLSGKD